jgi:site-specific DNA recombinase
MLDTTAPTPALLYGRNSSDEQKTDGTIKSQQDFLRSYAQLYKLNVVGEFWDEGVSGTTRLDERPEGRKLLGAAAANPGAVVLVYKLDRLGRSLKAIMDAHDRLEAGGLSIRSATEPFDTSTPFGRFMFQFLGSLAELDRASILERMAQGKDRVAGEGRWPGGSVPMGYEVDKTGLKPDQAGRLVPSGRHIEQLGMTEAEAAAQIIANIAAGSTLCAESARLNGLGVPCVQRYPSGQEPKGASERPPGRWKPGRLHQMVHNLMYSQGHAVIKTKRGEVEVKTPPLIDLETQRRAILQLTRNRSLSLANVKRDYLLRGLIVCAGCGSNYSGTTRTPSAKAGRTKDYSYYSCGCVVQPKNYPGKECRAKSVRADELEALV